MPIAGLGGIDIRTSEDDWVVTGVHRGEPFRRYVSPNTSSENAIALVAQILKLTPDGLQWIRAQRRHEVERCIRLDGDWLRSRTI
jgi:hypothetical protein